MTSGTILPARDCIVVTDGNRDSSLVAPLIDDVRQLIVEAWDSGFAPRYLLVDDATYATLLRVKASERARASPLYLLGLAVERRALATVGEP